MTPNPSAQFKPDDLYISPFTSVRSYNPETGDPIYTPIERNTSPTGLAILDAYARRHNSGSYFSNNSFIRSQGIDSRDFSALCRVLVGVTPLDLHQHLLYRCADDLLRYTDLSIEQVARRCGANRATTLCTLIQRRYKCSPAQRRRALRKRGDAGRYAV